MRAFNKQRELRIDFFITLIFLIFSDIPEFVNQNETLKKIWIEKWDQLVTNSFDLSDVNRMHFSYIIFNILESFGS